MNKPLRLGISGSSFIYAMPRELTVAAYVRGLTDRPGRFDDRQNRMMAEFMRDLMRAVNASEIEAMECYHSTSWDSETIEQVVLNRPNVEFWSVHAPYGRYADPSCPDDSVRAEALAAYTDAVNVAARLGAKVVVAHPGANIQYDIPKRARMEIAAESLREIAVLAAQSGIGIAVEPLPKQEVGSSLDEVLWLVERIGLPNVGVNFDTNHVFPAETVPDLIRQAGRLIMSVHASDHDGQERHWLPLTGILDWTAVLSALLEVGYQGPLIYETHIRDTSSCEDVVRAVVENYRRLMECCGTGGVSVPLGEAHVGE